MSKRAIQRRQPKSQPEVPPQPTTRARWIVPSICLGLVALIWIVFGQTIGHEFVNFDDHQYVYENQHVARGLTIEGVKYAFTQKLSSNWHPLTILSHMLDGQFFGLKPSGHHFTSVLLHTAAALALFGFLLDATGKVWRSAFVAAVFAIHPLRVESVAWVSERKDVLSGLFFMLTLWAYLRYVRKPGAGRYVLMAILIACGLMSKPMLVTVPLVLLLLDYWPLRRDTPLRKMLLEKVPLLAISAGSALATLFVQSGAIVAPDVVSLPMRIGNGCLSCLIYVRQMFWPVGLSPFYPHPMDLLTTGAVLLAFAILVAITGAAIFFGRSHRYLAVGWLWFLIMVLPILGIVQVGQQAHADRYTYLPQIGLYLIVGWGITELLSGWNYRRALLSTAAAAVLVLLAVRASSQTAIWHDSERLWRHALDVTKYNYVAHGSLGQFLWSKKRIAEAIPHYQRALVISPKNAEMHNTVGLGLLQTGKPSEAIAHWKKALEVAPEDLNAQSNLAWVFATCPEGFMRDGPRAVTLARNVIARSGTKTPILLRTLAAAYAESGQFPEAIAATREAMALATATGNASLAAELQRQISDYQLELPLRDPTFKNVQPLALP